MGEIAHEGSDTSPYGFTDREFLILTVAPRSAAFISLSCALYMAILAWKSRERLYHRLMFCLSLHLVLFSLWSLYGSSAMPADTPGVWGARGTIHTCSLQGFGFQISMAAPFYYVCLSFYSFLAVRHNYDVSKFLWVEKWIHVGVHVFPIGSAIYLLMVDALNPGVSVCWIESTPFGCGKGTNVPCERGPQDIFVVAMVNAFCPYAFCLVVPTCVMGALYWETKQRHDMVHLEASTVAKQASLYLLALYASYIFNFINGFVWWYKDEPQFLLTVLASTTVNLLGVWILAIYLHFRVVRPSRRCHRRKPRRQLQRQQQEDNPTTTISTTANTAVEPGLMEEQPTTSTLTQTTCQPEQASTSSLQLDSSSERQPAEGGRSPLPQRSYSFNIFDGSNATGQYAEYIYEADSDEIREDFRESEQWSDIQEYLR